MNDNQTITAPNDAVYLDQFMAELPCNCLFNKGLTGCGATELALTNPIPTIVAMPYIALVENKTNKLDRKIPVLGVSGGVSFTDIADFATTHKPLKIATTYDSLPKVIKALASVGIDAYKELFLLVDEWHVLFNSYVFRNEAIKELLYTANQFDKVTYMTATPIERAYILDELKHLPTTQVH